MLTINQIGKADMEGQKEDRERLFAVGVAWEMLSKKPKRNDIVYRMTDDGELCKMRVVKVGELLIDLQELPNGWGSVAYPYTNIGYDKDTGEYAVISNEEAIRRGYRRWKYQE